MIDNQNAYDGLYIRSVPGKSVPKNVRTTTVSIDKYNELVRKSRIKIKRALIAGIIGGMVLSTAGAVTIEKGIPAIKEALSVSYELGHDYDGFRDEYIVPNTHRTEDSNHYLFYDYKLIAKGLSEYGDKDFDKNLYYCLQALDTKNVDEVLEYVDKYRYSVVDSDGVRHSRNFRYYLAVHDCYDPDIDVTDEVLLNDDKAYDKAVDKFKKTIKKSIKASFEIEQSFDEVEDNYNQKQAELEQMMKDYNMDGPQEDKVKGL